MFGSRKPADGCTREGIASEVLMRRVGMRYLRALAVAVVVVPLVAGTGCVTKQVYDRDIQVERSKTVQALKELDQARADLKRANETVTELTSAAADLSRVKEKLADEQRRVTTLEASIKTEVEKARKAQERADQEKGRSASRGSAAQLTKAREEIAALKKEVEKLKEGEKPKEGKEGEKPKKEKETKATTPPRKAPGAPPMAPAAPPMAPAAPPMAPPGPPR